MSLRTKLSAGATSLALAGTLLVGGIAYAQRPATHNRPNRMLERAQIVLDLSDSQVAQIRTILNQNRTAARPLFKQIHDERLALKQAVENGKTDTATLQPLANQLGQTVSQLAVMRAQVAGQIYPILTPAQRAKAEKLHGLFEQRAGRFMMHGN